MPYRRALPREQWMASVMEHLIAGRHVIITGESGLGKTFVLDTLARRLSDSGRNTVRLSCRDPHIAREQAHAAPADATLFIDDIEYADAALLAYFTERFAQQGNSLSALQRHHDSADFESVVAQASEHMPTLLEGLPHWVQFELEPLTDLEMERFIYRYSGEPLDSFTVDVIRRLSCGRPGWATDLLALALRGRLVDDLRPSIDVRGLRELHLPSLRAAASDIGQLSEDAAAAAVVLSEIDPLDPTQARDLVGWEVVHELMSRGILAPDDQSHLVGVPAFLAVAVRSQASPAAIEQARLTAAEQLLLQEAIGIPLSPADSRFCARTAAAHSFGTETGTADALRRLLRRTTEDLLAFGDEGRSRALLMRSAGLGVSISGTFGARAMAVIGGARQGLAKLSESRASAETVDRAERMAARFLQTVLEAELSSSAPGVVTESERDATANGADELADALKLFRLWNATGSIAADLPFVRQMAKEDRASDLQLIAAALFKFELLWNGYQPLPADSVEFLELLQRAGLTDTTKYREFVDTAVISYAIMLLLSERHVERAKELTALVQGLPSSELHQRWLTHLLTAATALTCGRGERAQIEWQAFEHALPRFLPRRLRDRISAISGMIGDAVTYAQGTASEQRWRAASDRNASNRDIWRPWYLVAYLLGQQERLPRWESAPDPSKHLGVIALMHEHAQASEQQNPAALQRVAQKLASRDLGGPALSALRETRDILLKRRASGAVAQCDRQIVEVRTSMLAAVPWLRDVDLPQAAASRLTPRERDSARLAASGLSNVEISRELECSVRTVESHLSQARAKLGISSRQDFKRHPSLMN